MSEQLTIQNKIIFGFISLLIAFALVVNFVFITRFSEHSQANAEQALDAIAKSVQAEIDNRAITAAAIAETLAALPPLQQAFAADDRAQLLALIAPVFERAKQEHGIKQIQFSTPDSHSYLRAHKPETFGDDLSGVRETINVANRTRKPATGVEIGPWGLGIRGVVPMLDGTRHLGSVEAGLSLDQAFLSLMKQRYSADIAIFLERDQSFEKLASTGSDALSQDAMGTIFKNEQQLLSQLKADGRHTMTLGQVLRDFSGKAVGIVVLSRDVTADIEARNHMIGVILGVTAVGLLLGSVVGILIARGISRPLGAEPNKMQQLAYRVAHGDLNLPPVRGTLSGVYQSLHEMVAHLKNTVSRVDESAGVINDHAAQMTRSAEELQKRTNSQSESLQSTAESMHEISATVEQNAENARNASDLAQQVRQQAEQGGKIVDKVVTAMRDISHSSQQATDIISVIDEIAFQTNLLALNAAVEAARSGEHGRGFAVVANEVRNLAQRSSQAAHDIKRLIETSAQNVDRGAALVDEAGHSLQEILSSTRELTQIVTSIADANSEQAKGVALINNAINNVDQSTAGNTRLAAESTKIAHALGEEADRLQDLMAYFNSEQTTYQSSQNMALAYAPRAA